MQYRTACTTLHCNSVLYFGIGRILRAISAHCARAPHVAIKATHMLTRGRIYLHVEGFIYMDHFARPCASALAPYSERPMTVYPKIHIITTTHDDKNCNIQLPI